MFVVGSRQARVAVVVGALVASLVVVPASDVGAQSGALRVSENRRMGSEPGVSRGTDVPGLAVNPADPRHVVEVHIDLLNQECVHRVSFDAGSTWADGVLRAPAEFVAPPCTSPGDTAYVAMDASVEFGSGQSVYTTFSSKRGDDGDSVLVAKSSDGGRSFATAVVAIPGGTGGEPFYARPKLAVEARPGGDVVYVTAWSLGTEGGATPTRPRRIVVAVSTDGGATWGAPVAVNPPSESGREHTQPVVAPDGTVYVAYRDAEFLSDGPLIVARSNDLGATWTGVQVREIGGDPNPDLLVDRDDGTLHLAYHEASTNGDEDVFVQRSTDGALTWSEPVRVNDDPVGNGARQRLAHLSAAPGRLDVVWHDRRHTYQGPPFPVARGEGDTYYAFSTDGGATFSANRRITDRTINRAVGFDLRTETYTSYTPVSVPVGDDMVLFAWADSRQGNFHNDTQDIYQATLDRSATGPVPVTETPTVVGPAGLSVGMSRLAYPGGVEALNADGVPATRVVIVNESDAGAALAGGVLARGHFGPVLMSAAEGLSANVSDEVARLRPVGAYVIGDEASLSAGVVADLAAAGVRQSEIERISGTSPADTARLIAERLDFRADFEKDPADPDFRPAFDAAVIVNPDTPEAVSASALAAALRLPVLFTGADAVPDATSDALDTLDIDATLVIGGTAAVSDDAAAGLPGPERLADSRAVVAESVERGLPTNIAYVADTGSPMEAATMGAAVARLGGLLVLGSPEGAQGTLDDLSLADGLDRLVVAAPELSRADLALACVGEIAEQFSDIDGNVHEPAINCIADRGIALGAPGGRPEGVYGPELAVTRAQMASFIARMIDEADPEALAPAPAGNRFDCDVEAGNAHFGAIQRLAAAGVVLGGPGGLPSDCYGPDQPVRRDQMTSFVNRAVEAITGTLLVSDDDAFTDDETSVHENNINAVAARDIVLGTGGGLYAPDGEVRRDQMASFVARTLDFVIEVHV